MGAKGPPQQGESQTPATIVMILVQMAFAGWHVLGKVALNTGVSPLFFALIREAGASIVLLLLAAVCDKKPKMPNRAEAMVFLTLGVLIFINIVGFILALNLVSPITAAIYQPLIPVWTAFWAILFKVEPANPYMLTGIAISVSGAVVAAMSESHPSNDEGLEGVPEVLLESEAQSMGITEEDQQSFMQRMAENSLLGHGILLVQTLALGTLYLVQKKIVHDFPSLTSTAWYYSIGSFLTVVMCIGYFQSLDSLLHEFSYLSNTHVLVAFLYAVVVGTAFTYGGSTWANKKLHASIVSLYTVLQSPFTLILSIFTLGAKPEVQDVVCMVLIIFGMTLVVGSKMKEAEEMKKEGGLGGNTDPLRGISYEPVGGDEGKNI
uniref:WAT1-related protein n=1 Tax=Chloropicon laureae TaxID=464258 RepID=A0A7S2Z197_9CHLO|mmetsp:Transcript_14200/g.36610  ORF Transcript_14200/g.36610 Transcript_14200/m.36610 type:complete len:378 (+) Transcript_14200:41-1174(+)|eukprot:CAMPEP_0197486574 /NCGR_PEP_ID=MMETSP1311-20131121/1542_1 /TAXON_ID=464262 /ORGANISM="Genus nov. species nov., Strain RCC856" /LENGTH=377 /DNA_ID=CAMNT_0043029759 /DNA_START=32 /DNA_END=1165 /DNA_ORIENTATION=-